MGRGPFWAEDEMQILRDHPGLTAKQLKEQYLPWRSQHAIREKITHRDEKVKPEVKEPGEYVELVHQFLVADHECFAIWLKWNGYASASVLSVDRMRICTVLCIAKGA